MSSSVAIAKEVGAEELDKEFDVDESPFSVGRIEPLKLEAGGFVDAVVSDATGGAAKFFVQPLVYDEFATKFSEILYQFYTLFTDNELKIPPQALVTKGALCAAKWDEDGRWYRAKILKRESAATVKVLFVDYGNSAVTKISDTKMLIKRFDLESVPTLAIECSDSLAEYIDLQIFKTKAEGRAITIKIDEVFDERTVTTTMYRVKNEKEVNLSEQLATMKLKK